MWRQVAQAARLPASRLLVARRPLLPRPGRLGCATHPAHAHAHAHSTSTSTSTSTAAAAPASAAADAAALAARGLELLESDQPAEALACLQAAVAWGDDFDGVADDHDRDR